MCCCSLRKVDYSTCHRTLSSKKCSSSILILHTLGLIRLGGATPLVTVGIKGFFRKLCISGVLCGWMTLLDRAYPTRRLLLGSWLPRFHCVSVALLFGPCPPRAFSIWMVPLPRAYVAQRFCCPGLIQLGDSIEFTKPIMI